LTAQVNFGGMTTPPRTKSRERQKYKKYKNPTQQPHLIAVFAATKAVRNSRIILALEAKPAGHRGERTMRISKSAHLMRLLQTQDVLLSGLIYAVTFDCMWVAGLISLETNLLHLQLTPVVLLLALLSSHRHEPQLHGVGLVSSMISAARFSLFVAAGLLVMAFFGSFQGISGPAISIFAISLFGVLVGNRSVLRFWYLKGFREHPDNHLKVVVIGNGPRAQALIDSYSRLSEWGVDIVGVMDPAVPGRNTPQLSIEMEADPLPRDPRTGVFRGVLSLDRIREVLATTVIDEVVVCVPRSLLNEVGEIVEACQEEGVCVKFLADLYPVPSGTVRLDAVGRQPILSFEPVAIHESMLIFKRIFDLLLAIPMLILLAPFFVLVALAIKLDSTGPVFFVQKRVGLNKRTFGLVKFRSMVQDAESRIQDLEHLNEAAGPIFKINNDPRVTRVGKFIRKTSIDELPQLINVLRGHMSLIGPRPMSIRDVDQFSLGIQRRRFSVRPGLACLREVSGRSRLSFERWLELDLEYIDRWSLWLDIKILARLVPAVIKGDGAS
jgi:exopolysaccharide biosynthesis polyprenyl glycosylphosphotransferase